MMKKWIVFLLLALGLPVFGRCRFWGEYLYMQPRASNLDYALAQSGGDNTLVDIVYLEPEYSSGFGVAGFLHFPTFCIELGAEWTHLDTSRNESLFSNDSLVRAFFSPRIPDIDTSNRVEANYKLCYDALDFLVGSPYTSGCLDVLPQIGMRVARIDQRMKANFSDPTDVLYNEQLQQWNLGLVLAGDVSYPFFCCQWGIYAKGKIALMRGRINGSTDVQGVTIGPSANFLPGYKYNRFAPSFDLGVGLLYVQPCIMWRLGYEITHYCLDDFIYPTSLIDSESFPVNRNQAFFSLGGLILRGEFSF